MAGAGRGGGGGTVRELVAVGACDGGAHIMADPETVERLEESTPEAECCSRSRGSNGTFRGSPPGSCCCLPVPTS